MKRACKTESRTASALGDRRGVALVIVLGLLALMVLMGVSFSIYMRTERVAAGGFRNDVRTRQLLHASLNRALVAIEAGTGDQFYPSWYYLESSTLDSNSVASGAVIAGATNPPVMDWIPRGALGPNAKPEPRWVDLEPFAQMEGRLGYLVVNCSGLVDANHAGGLARSIGVDPSEIQVDVLPDVKSAAALSANAPYETLQELTSVGVARGALYGQSVTLVDYSACPLGRLDVATGLAVTNLVDVGDLTRESEIKTSLMSCLQVLAPDADFIFKNLQDYTDADCIPKDLASPCTESVPMINEIQVVTAFTTDEADGVPVPAGFCAPKLTFYAEWSYPFVKASPHTFAIKPKVTVTASAPLFKVADIPDDEVATDYVPGATKSPQVPPHMVEIATVFGAPLKIAGHEGELMSFTVTAELQVRQGGNVVDEVKGISIATTPIPVPSTAVKTDGMECIDPRFNWDAREGEGQWLSYAAVVDMTKNAGDRDGSGERLNAVSQFWLASGDEHTDHHDQMFVADRPLKQVSELSYLLRGVGLENRWKTIHLYDTDDTPAMDPILDYFVVGKPIVHGRINPNTRQSDVVAALMTDLPLDSYPEEPGAAPLSGAQVDAITNWWANGGAVSGTITNLADIGHLTGLFTLPGITNLTFLQKEALLRNSAGLMAPRQQYFVILLYAQTTRVVPQVPGKSVVAGTRGIAEVWRDAYPDASGRHPCVIRLFRLVNEK